MIFFGFELDHIYFLIIFLIVAGVLCFIEEFKKNNKNKEGE